jgi:hypothetical protein
LSNAGDGNDPTYSAGYAEVAYDAPAGQYVVTFAADRHRDGMVDGEIEAFVRRVNGGNGAHFGDDERISHLGPDGQSGFPAAWNAIACGASNGDCLVVWMGSDNVGGLLQNEWEIFGQGFVPDLVSDSFESGDLLGWSDFVGP